MAKAVSVVAAAIVVLVLPVLFWIDLQASSFGGVSVFYFSTQVLGLVGFVVFFFQFVLASRVRPFEKQLGLDKLFLVHRVTGVVGLGLILLHAISQTIYDLTVRGFLQINVGKLLGILAFTGLLVVGLVALIHKRFKYETWKNIHKAAYFLFPLAFAHSIVIGTTLDFSLPTQIMWFVLIGIYGLIVISRIATLVRIRNNPFVVEEVRPETHDVTTLRLKGPAFSHLPGQFAIITLERGGKSAPEHPFTIASSPSRGGLEFSIKASGDFTSTIPETKPGDKVFVQGPFGIFSYRNVETDSLVFIAGGIGITPIMSMLRDIRDTSADKKALLIWGNKTEEDIAFRDEIDEMKNSLPGFSVVHVMSHQEDWEGEKGFVTGEVIRKHVDDYASKHYFLCGPPIMMDKVTTTLRGLGVPSSQLHFEKFAL